MIPRIQSEMLEKLCPMTRLEKNCVGPKCAVWEWGGDAPANFLQTVELRKVYPDLSDTELDTKYQELHDQFSRLAIDGVDCEEGDTLRIIEQKGSWTIKLQIVHEYKRVGYCGIAAS